MQMFVSHETSVPVDFPSAAARLGNLSRGDALLTASSAAYDQGVTGLLRVGPAPGFSRLVRAELGQLTYRGETAVLAIRWQATGPGGRLFPSLDADIQVRAAGDDTTVLRLDGAYRPPLGDAGAAIDGAVLHSVANATIRRFLAQVAGLITHPEPGTAPGGFRQPARDPGPS